MKTITALLALLLCGCEKPATSTLKDTFSLPDGTPVKCYKVDRGDRTHWIYVVDKTVSLTSNYETGSKNKTQHVEVTLEK